MKDFAAKHHIKHLKVALYSPTSNGLVERVNTFLKEGVQTSIAMGSQVKVFLKEKVWNYHLTPHSTTGVPPFTLLRKRHPRAQLCPDWLRDTLPKNNHCFCTISELVKERVTLTQTKQKSQYDCPMLQEPLIFM